MLGSGSKCSRVGFLSSGDLKEKDTSKAIIAFDATKTLQS